MAANLPDRINLGSGKHFLAECLNIDIDPQWQPDVLCDLSQGLPMGKRFDSDRFGAIELLPASFGAIVANDVLEHVPNLIGLMTTCLHLLRDGGEFDIRVPYDLSFGAWQDPTHIRAFNERSWLYYTDWHWYLGWMESRFDTVLLEMDPSPFGSDLLSQGAELAGICHVPRAIDAMHVILRKRALTAEERVSAQSFLSRKT